MRRLIVLMVFVCGLVIAPTSAFTQDYKLSDAFITPYTGNLLDGFGGFVGGEFPNQHDWTIGNRCPYPDTNPATDAMVFSTDDGYAWGERMRIHKSGRIGIGTTNPLFPFEIEWNPPNNNINPIAVFKATGTSSSAGAIRFQNTNDNYFNIGITWNNAFAIGEYNKNISLNGDFLRITPTGNVGIGTTSPGAQLDVKADTTTWGGWYEAIRFSQSAHSAITHPGGGLLFGLHGDGQFFFADTNEGEYIMVLDSNPTGGGNVGIGIRVPSSKLQVIGDIRASIYRSGDGSAGLTRTIGVLGGHGLPCSVTIKDGLITGTSCPSW